MSANMKRKLKELWRERQQLRFATWGSILFVSICFWFAIIFGLVKLFS